MDYGFQLRIIGLRDGRELWSHALSGVYRRPPPAPDWEGIFGGEVGPGVPRGGGGPFYRSEDELAAALNRAIARRLPTR